MAKTLVGKLSPKAMGWSKAQIGVAVEKISELDKVFLGRVAGIVTGLRETVDEATGAIQTGLKGSFKAISTKTDEAGVVVEVVSGVCYLPSGIQDTIEAALATASEGAANSRSKPTVTFAVDLYAIKASNRAGYGYVAEPILEASESDPVDALLSSAALARPNAQLALAAPAGDAPPAGEPTPVAGEPAPAGDNPAPAGDTAPPPAKGKGK